MTSVHWQNSAIQIISRSTDAVALHVICTQGHGCLDGLSPRDCVLIVRENLEAPPRVAGADDLEGRGGNNFVLEQGRSGWAPPIEEIVHLVRASTEISRSKLSPGDTEVGEVDTVQFL